MQNAPRGAELQVKKIAECSKRSRIAGQEYCRMLQEEKNCRSKVLQEEHSAILLTFIKLLFVIEIFVLSIFEWLLKTGFTVLTELGQWVRALLSSKGSGEQMAD